tara:strand:+ start:145 stop:786 length:642 start_codon:yes stop_codon:yes gene_type:complete
MNSDEEMKLMGQMSASIARTIGQGVNTQARLLFVDEMMELTSKGFSEDEIDKILITKFKVEHPFDAFLAFGGKKAPITDEEALLDLVVLGRGKSEISGEEINAHKEKLEAKKESIQKKNREEREEKNQKALARRRKEKVRKNRAKLLERVFGFGWLGIVSCFGIWFALAFTLIELDVVNFWNSSKVLIWYVMPPLIALMIIAWVRNFILKKKP